MRIVDTLTYDRNSNLFQQQNKTTDLKGMNEALQKRTERAVSVEFSEEGMAALREKCRGTSGDKVNMLYQREECPPVELDSTGADVWSQSLSVHRSASLRAIRESGQEYGFEDIMAASLESYADLYEEINVGYENGTREIWVADGTNGKRKLTKEEEIERLNCAYQKEIKWQTMVMNSRKETEKAKNITFSGSTTSSVQSDDSDVSADEKELSRLMNDMRKEYLAQRENGAYEKNMGQAKMIASSLLNGFDLKNHMITIFEGVSLIK